MDTECPDVSPGLTADPEYREMAVIIKFEQLRLVDSPNTELALDGGDQRGALEQGAGQGLEGAC